MDISQAPLWIKNNISLKAFLLGLAVIALLYVGALSSILLGGKETVAHLQARLPSKTVVIEQKNAPEILPDEAGDTPPPHHDNASTSSTESPMAPPPIEINKTPKPQTNSGTRAGLKPAPFEGLTEETKEGALLPRISQAGLSPFHAYKRPFIYAGEPLISLVVADFGLSQKMSKKAILTLPPAATMLLSPYTLKPDFWQEKARKSGHEIWLNLPLQNSKYPQEDPGPRAILVRSSLKKNKENMEWILSRASGYVGVSHFSDDVIVKSHSIFKHVFQELNQRGLAYFEMNEEAPSLIETQALATNMPYARNSLAINSLKDLGALEEKARKRGYAVGLIRPSPNMIETTLNWSKALKDKGIILAPLSTIAETTR